MSKRVDRRQFLETSAGIAATAAVAPLVAQQTDLPSRRMHVGVMGLGRGLSLAQTFAVKPGVEVKYVCDVDSNRTSAGQAAVEKVAGKRPEGVTDFRHILDDPDIDALVCAAPNHWHAHATIMACAAGKHVYVEKPCSHNPREGELMIEAARKYDRAVQVGTQRRSNTGYVPAITKVHEGIIGDVYCARASFHTARKSIGIGNRVDVPPTLDYELWQGPAPRVPYVDNRIPYNWHWFWHWGNGEIGNNGVHALDVCRWGLAADYPISVVSSGGDYRYEDDQQTPDTNVAVFEFPGHKQISFEGLSRNRHKDTKAFISFYGAQGAMEIDLKGNYTIFDAGDKLVDEGQSKGASDPDHVSNFIAAIRQGDHLQLAAEITEGHKSTLLSQLANIAYRAKSALQCSPANGHIVGNERAMSMWQRKYEPGWIPTV